MLNIESVNLMQLTIDLAKKNLAKNKIPVAAIIVDGQTNEIIATATNDNSPLGHAELKAIKKATIRDSLITNKICIYNGKGRISKIPKLILESHLQN